MGLNLTYSNDGVHLGDLVVAKAHLIWCRGRTTLAKGIKIKWQEFIDYMKSE